MINIAAMRCPVCDAVLTEGELFNWNHEDGLCNECETSVREEVRVWEEDQAEKEEEQKKSGNQSSPQDQSGSQPYITHVLKAYFLLLMVQDVKQPQNIALAGSNMKVKSTQELITS